MKTKPYKYIIPRQGIHCILNTYKKCLHTVVYFHSGTRKTKGKKTKQYMYVNKHSSSIPTGKNMNHDSVIKSHLSSMNIVIKKMHTIQSSNT